MRRAPPSATQARRPADKRLNAARSTQRDASAPLLGPPTRRYPVAHMPVKIEVAEPKERFVAAAIDFVPIFVVFLVLWSVGAGTAASVWAIIGSLYFIVRDLIG